MGQLRFEPKGVKLAPLEYKRYWEALNEAANMAETHDIYWDAEDADCLRRDKSALQRVATQEGIELKIRRKRGTNTLILSIRRDNVRQPLSKSEYEERILEVLKKEGRAMSRQEVINVGDLDDKPWMKRIKHLVNKGKVQKVGERINTRYSLP